MTNYMNPDRSFINFLAPTLCGIKPASLFTVADDEISEGTINRWKSGTEKQNLCLAALRYSTRRWMIIVYDFDWIARLLSDRSIQSYLIEKGYSCPSDTCSTLGELFSRLEIGGTFPHEVGLFLGYPYQDVVDFEKNEGRNCKYCGYWKSYSNPSQAKICCDQYRCCTRMCRQWFEQGLSVPQIIKKYREAAQDAA